MQGFLRISSAEMLIRKSAAEVTVLVNISPKAIA